MTPKQHTFCQEYILDMNATQAAIRAGYSAATASSQGQRLLRNVEIQKLICELQENRIQRLQIDADTVLEHIARIAYGKGGASARDRLKALEMLGRHIGLFEPTVVRQQASQREEDSIVFRLANGEQVKIA